MNQARCDEGLPGTGRIKSFLAAMWLAVILGSVPGQPWLKASTGKARMVSSSPLWPSPFPLAMLA
jgi:hypothetical protein